MDGRIKAINTLLKKCRWQVEQAVIACGQQESLEREISARLERLEGELARIDADLNASRARGSAIAVEMVEQAQRYRSLVDERRLRCGEGLNEQKKAVNKARSELIRFKETEISLDNKLSEMIRCFRGQRDKKMQRQLDELAVSPSAIRAAFAVSDPLLEEQL